MKGHHHKLHVWQVNHIVVEMFNTNILSENNPKQKEALSIQKIFLFKICLSFSIDKDMKNLLLVCQNILSVLTNFCSNQQRKKNIIAEESSNLNKLFHSESEYNLFTYTFLGHLQSEG
jgi:hypothetical protein